MIAESEYEQLTGKVRDFKAFLVGGPSLEGLQLARAPTRDAVL